MNNNTEPKKTNDKSRYLEFILGNESYAVELMKVREVISMPEFTPLPQTPKYVCGVMNLRGTVLSVIDLRTKFNIKPSANKAENAVIIFNLDDKIIGVVVDSVNKVLNVTADQIKPVPDMSMVQEEIALGVIQHEDRLTLWLDPVALLGKEGIISRKVA